MNDWKMHKSPRDYYNGAATHNRFIYGMRAINKVFSKHIPEAKKIENVILRCLTCPAILKNKKSAYCSPCGSEKREQAQREYNKSFFKLR